ncbi:MAG: hypothetical protein IKT16_03920 [Desulfovibrio sp.]|nr:hypothetical protein [Desulfovibrio sp.]
MSNKAARLCTLFALACLVLLCTLGLQPSCAHGQSLAELVKERGELRFALCAGQAGALEEECGVLDEETVWVLRGDGSATLRAKAFSTRGEWLEQKDAVVIVSHMDDVVEYRSPYLQASVGLIRPQLVHFASPDLDKDAPASFEELFAHAGTRTFYACVKPTYATTDEECSETSRQHYFSFSRDGTGAYGKATRKEPVRFTWTWKAPVITAFIKAESLGRFVQGRYLELDSPYKGRRGSARYQLLDGQMR